MKTTKGYKVMSIKNPDGEIRFYIVMDKEFIEPIKDEKMRLFETKKTVGEIVLNGSHWNFEPSLLGYVISKIEKIVRKAGLRD